GRWRADRAYTRRTLRTRCPFRRRRAPGAPCSGRAVHRPQPLPAARDVQPPVALAAEPALAVPGRAAPTRAALTPAGPPRAGPTRAAPTPAGPPRAGLTRAALTRAALTPAGLPRVGLPRAGLTPVGPPRAGPGVPHLVDPCLGESPYLVAPAPYLGAPRLAERPRAPSRCAMPHLGCGPPSLLRRCRARRLAGSI